MHWGVLYVPEHHQAHLSVVSASVLGMISKCYSADKGAFGKINHPLRSVQSRGPPIEALLISTVNYVCFVF